MIKSGLPASLSTQRTSTRSARRGALNDARHRLRIRSATAESWKICSRASDLHRASVVPVPRYDSTTARYDRCTTDVRQMYDSYDSYDSTTVRQYDSFTTATTVRQLRLYDSTTAYSLDPPLREQACGRGSVFLPPSGSRGHLLALMAIS